MEIRNALTFVIEIDRIESTGINTVVTRQKELRTQTQNSEDRETESEDRTYTEPRDRRTSLARACRRILDRDWPRSLETEPSGRTWQGILD